MREDLLHFIWKTNKLGAKKLITTSKQELVIKNLGYHNNKAGPDFFNAQIEIGGQLWAGNVEIHLKSSDWYAHGHEVDVSYDNVILHVVWEDDISVFRKDKSEIPTLELKNIIESTTLDAYQRLLHNTSRKFINCEKDYNAVDVFIKSNWLEGLYIERLEEKSKFIFQLLEDSKNNWEQVLFSMLLKNFGTKVNGATFFELSKYISFSTVRKLQSNQLGLESVFLGMAGLLDSKEITDHYFIELGKEFKFQKNKFQLNTEHALRPDFFGLRPNNFPTIRLSQLASLYGSRENLFSKIMALSKVEDVYELFKIKAADYWDTHFTFGKVSKHRKKSITTSFVDLLLINTIIPLKFAYSKSLGKNDNEAIIAMLLMLKTEKNTIITKYNGLGEKTKNAFESQSKLQLYNNYCTKNKCLQCAIGTSLLNKKA